MKRVELIKIKGKEGKEIPLLVKQESGYKVYRLVPDRSIENGKVVEEILKTFHALRNMPVRIDDDGKKKILYDPNMPIYYEILIDKGELSFNYIIPTKYEEIIVNKINSVYRRATFKEREDYYDDFKESMYHKFDFKRHFMYSLNTDYRENRFIEGILNSVHSIDKEDKVLIQLGIMPLGERWKDAWRVAYEKVREGNEPMVSNGVGEYILDRAFKLSEGVLSVADMFMGGSYEEPERITSRRNQAGFNNYRDNPRGREGSSGNSIGSSNSGMTREKVIYDGFKTQIKLFSNNSKKLYYYAKLFDGVFKVLDGDQQLVLSSSKRNKGKDRNMGIQVNKNIMSTKEVSTLIQPPNARIQREYIGSMESISRVETKIPYQLTIGKIPIGTTTYKGEEINVYWPIERHMAPMHKVITGLQRTGKSSYITNFAIDAMRGGDSVFLIDTIKNCELANDVRDHLPEDLKNKIVVLDFSDLDHLIPLTWSEITNVETNDIRERMKIASMVGGNFEYFLETAGELKGDAQKLSPKMKSYLSSACRVVLSIRGTTIKDIIDCLMYVESRHKFIKESGLDSDNSAVQDLLRLDQEDKEGELSTKYSEIGGIIDRASILFNDYMMEILLGAKDNGKINFKEWADGGYCVIMKMSELQFSRNTLKTLVTLIYSKIWLAMLARGSSSETCEHRLTHVILDEIHNFPQVTEMLKLNCRESAKYGLSYVFTSHLLKDLRGLLPYIEGSGGNYMLFKTTKDNFTLLETELELGGFTLEECLKVKDYHTLNRVNYDRDYTVFTSKVPDLVSKRYPKTDRSYLDKEHSIKYGVKFEG